MHERHSSWAEALGVLTGLALLIWQFSDQAWQQAQHQAALASHTEPGLGPIIGPVMVGGFVWAVLRSFGGNRGNGNGGQE